MLDLLEKELQSMDDEARRTVMLAVSENWRVPPMTRETIAGDDEPIYLTKMPTFINEATGLMDYDKADQMMSTGQIAYPMMLKKAPIISIVRSPSGFVIESADERLAELAEHNLGDVLKKRIDEILTFLEYGAYFGEVTYEPGYPQDYGLTKSPVPYWLIEDFHGCHPRTIKKIERNEKTRAFEGFRQRGNRVLEDVFIQTNKALIIPNNGTFGNLRGVSVLEPVYVWWFWYELIWRSFLRFLQRAGVGVVIVKAPSKGRIEIAGRSVDNMQWALQMASSLHRTNYAAVPSDADPDSGKELWAIDYLKMGNNEGAQFIDALEILGNNIKNFLLTGDASSQDGGEYEVMLDTERTLGHIGMYISEHVLPKMWYWNGSSTRRVTLEFQGANSRILPLLFKLMAVAGNTAGDALRNVDWRQLFSKGGVPILTEEEVEEIREKELEERAVQYQGKDGEDEKAKRPPYGEGRWAAKRDEEGKPESLESMIESVSMIGEALSMDVIPLEGPRVAELERLGLRVSDKPIMLFNPYHDREGKFTDRAHAAAPLPKKNLKIHGRVDDRTEFLAQDAASYAFEKTGQKPIDVHLWKNSIGYAKELCGSDVRCYTNAGRIFGAYKDGAIHISPKGLRSIKEDRKFGEYLLAHEALHGRERSDGSLGADLSFEKDSIESYRMAWGRMMVEEGTTDLMARGLLDLSHDYWRKGVLKRPAYMPLMGAIAIMAGAASNWDKAKAWRFIDRLHYHINDQEYVFNMLNEAFYEPNSGWNGNTYYLLMVKLQLAAASNGYKSLKWLFS